jgi:hypothetical protein
MDGRGERRHANSEEGLGRDRLAGAGSRSFPSWPCLRRSFLRRSWRISPSSRRRLARCAASSKDGLNVFKGVPYAAAPVGALRWKSPVAAPVWSGVRDALDFGRGLPTTQAPPRRHLQLDR